ncbi:MAG: exo-beta-N-acetylmuramidase NamZ family protein [Verrucomicrobiales bacterium]
MPSIRTGLDVLVSKNFAPLRGLKVGLVTHPAAVDARLRHTIDLLAEAEGVHLARIFGPEHGLRGQAQDLASVPAEIGPGNSPKLISLYGETVASLHPISEHLLDLDALVIDLQDVGSRYYTFQATMLYCLEAALPRGLQVFVLDRPNPLGGVAVEGPGLQPGYESFVGPHDIATRHGLTMGELALLYENERDITGGELRIIPCEGWRRGMFWDQTGLPWVLPSPNMPTIETAFVYPGQCLLEGTNLSEGRGTTRPFELCGAPWLDATKLASRLDNEDLPGVIFRPAWFRPTFQKHAGVDCGGVQLHVTDRREFQPVRTGLSVLAALRELSAENFRWRTETYEFVDEPIAIDLLFGSDRERSALEGRRPPGEIFAAWQGEERAFGERRRAFLLYD